MPERRSGISLSREINQRSCTAKTQWQQKRKGRELRFQCPPPPRGNQIGTALMREVSMNNEIKDFFHEETLPPIPFWMTNAA